jgi:hypothetical protein
MAGLAALPTRGAQSARRPVATAAISENRQAHKKMCSGATPVCQKEGAERRRSDAAQPADAEPPTDAGCAHARRIELAAGGVRTGLAADDRQARDEDLR